MLSLFPKRWSVQAPNQTVRRFLFVQHESTLAGTRRATRLSRLFGEAILKFESGLRLRKITAHLDANAMPMRQAWHAICAHLKQSAAPFACNRW